MNKKELIKKLEEIAEWSYGDPEMAHGKADDLLLEFLGEDVKVAFENIDKWYA